MLWVIFIKQCGWSLFGIDLSLHRLYAVEGQISHTFYYKSSKMWRKVLCQLFSCNTTELL